MGEKVVDGVEYAGEKIICGAGYVGGKIICGAAYLGEKVEYAAGCVRNWVNNHTINVYEKMQDEILGLSGTYSLTSDTIGENKFININFKNGIFQSISVNFNLKVENFSSNLSIGFSPLGIQSIIQLALENNDNTYTVRGSSNIGGGSIEWGKGSNGTINGQGIRGSINPFDYFCLYGFTEKRSEMVTTRTEIGTYKNSAILELETAGIAVLFYELLRLTPAVAALAYSFFFLFNDKLNKNSCDLE